MNDMKTVEAWQNLLVIIVLLIQDANMFQDPEMYGVAAIVLIVVDLLMICLVLRHVFKRHLLGESKNDDDEVGNLYNPLLGGDPESVAEQRLLVGGPDTDNEEKQSSDSIPPGD